MYSMTNIRSRFHEMKTHFTSYSLFACVSMDLFEDTFHRFSEICLVQTLFIANVRTQKPLIFICAEFETGMH